jgi:hypothetical protein
LRRGDLLLFGLRKSRSPRSKNKVLVM